MDIDRYERIWIYISGVILGALFLVLLYSVYGLGLDLAADAGSIDPDQITSRPPFDQLGVTEVEPGRYRVVILARTWSFEPAEIRVPAGAEVEFLITSADVIHGFRVPQTTINRMITPGQITRVNYRFHEPGEFALFCHEYCGIGHHTMSGRIIVEPTTGAHSNR